MRVVVTFVCLLNLAFGYSQKASTDVQIEYKIYNNTYAPNTLYATLFVGGTTTIYLPKYSTKVFDTSKLAPGSRLGGNKVEVDFYYTKIDHTKKEILSFEAIGRNMFLVQDSYNELKWNITEETKDIAGYSCIKATTSFRGRDWVAWFAPDIALPYGPWKLHGLPGLITEAYETTNTYVWRIEKIEFKKSDLFDKDFKILVETRNKEPLSIKKFIEDEKEFHQNAHAEMNKKTGGSSEPARRTGYELKYEWEE